MRFRLAIALALLVVAATGSMADAGLVAGAPGEVVTIRAFDARRGAPLPDTIASIGPEGFARMRITRAEEIVRGGSVDERH